MQARELTVDAGSSPLTRGKPDGKLRTSGMSRLIPAHAGKTQRIEIHVSPSRAHPRSRGENTVAALALHGNAGSSPLTRGKQGGQALAVSALRLIPAHAGKTRSATSLRRARTAHPRSRGENVSLPLRARRDGGSSPLTRGKPIIDWHRGTGQRLIPAHAGKTRLGSRSSSLRAAHPRSRGENVVLILVPAVAAGSSPLTRGKHFLTCAFTAQIDQILETLELAASFGSYLIWVACATDAPQDQVRSIGLVLPSSRGAS